MTECPECAAEILISHDVMKGEVVSCGECGQDFEVVSTIPVSLRRAETVSEDWGQ